MPDGTKNYMTPWGHARMQNELSDLIRKERPEVVSVVAWAAGNGDRSENGDYIYGKKRLREEADGWNRLVAAIGAALKAEPNQV